MTKKGKKDEKEEDYVLPDKTEFLISDRIFQKTQAMVSKRSTEQTRLYISAQRRDELETELNDLKMRLHSSNKNIKFLTQQIAELVNDFACAKGYSPEEYNIYYDFETRTVKILGKKKTS